MHSHQRRLDSASIRLRRLPSGERLGAFFVGGRPQVMSRNLRGTAVFAIVFGIMPLVFGQASQGAPQLIGRIEAALRTKDYSLAVRLSQVGVQEEPQDYRFWTLRGMALSGARQPLAALSAYERALRILPNYLPALEGVAEIDYQQGRPETKKRLQEILAVDPANQTAHDMLGITEFRAHNCRGAIEQFERAASMVNAQPGVLTMYGYCLSSLGRFSIAVPVLEKEVSLEPTNTSFYNLALVQWEAGLFSNALKTLQPLLDRGSSDEDLLTLAADINEHLNRTPQAVQLLRAAILANPKDPEAYLHFATLSSAHHSYQVGIDMLDAGLSQIPKAAALYLARGILYAQIGNLKKAAHDFDKAGTCDPTLSFLGSAEGLADMQTSNYGTAVATLRQEAKKHPNDALTEYLLAEALSTSGKSVNSLESREEIAAATRALQLDPKL